MHNVHVCACTIRCFNELKQCAYILKLTRMVKNGTRHTKDIFIVFISKAEVKKEELNKQIG